MESTKRTTMRGIKTSLNGKGRPCDALSLTIENRRGVLLVGINHPTRRNALTATARYELKKLICRSVTNPTVIGIVLRSTTSAFSAGQDLSESQTFRPNRIPEWIDEHMSLYKAILSFPKPIVAAIDGCCVGAGLQIAMLCDLRVGSNGAFFSLPELDDAIPCILGSWTLLDIIGRSRTMEMILTNRRVEASEALAWGILNELTAAADVLPTAIEWVESMANKSPLAFRLTKGRVSQQMLERATELAVHATFAHMQAFGTTAPMEAMKLFLNAHSDSGAQETPGIRKWNLSQGNALAPKRHTR